MSNSTVAAVLSSKALYVLCVLALRFTKSPVFEVNVIHTIEETAYCL